MPVTLTCLQDFGKLKNLNIVIVMIPTVSCLRTRSGNCSKITSWKLFPYQINVFLQYFQPHFPYQHVLINSAWTVCCWLESHQSCKSLVHPQMLSCCWTQKWYFQVKSKWWALVLRSVLVCLQWQCFSATHVPPLRVFCVCWCTALQWTWPRLTLSQFSLSLNILPFSFFSAIFLPPPHTFGCCVSWLLFHGLCGKTQVWQLP